MFTTEIHHREDPRERVFRGHSLLERQELPQPFQLVPTELGDVLPSLTISDDASHASECHFDERIGDLAGLSRIGEVTQSSHQQLNVRSHRILA